jgi:hypothetical protein
MATMNVAPLFYSRTPVDQKNDIAQKNPKIILKNCLKIEIYFETNT